PCSPPKANRKYPARPQRRVSSEVIKKRTADNKSVVSTAASATTSRIAPDFFPFPAAGTPRTTTTTAAGIMVTTMDALDEVHFVNPDAVRARSRRRVKLTAARARLAALAASGGGASSLGEEGAGPGVSEKEVRKQQRMLRNRESAALSRKRKSDRIGELEIQVEALQEENRRLRQRIDRKEDDGRDAGNGNGNGRVLNAGEMTASRSPPAAAAGNGCVINTAASPPPPATAAWAPTDLAARAALAATSSIILPSASTTTIIPTTPPATNSDLAAGNKVFRGGPGVPVAAASTCSATASSASSSSFPASANACFNMISRPAVFA
ncbi:unnamed protein product, partial [Ectocarpus sp. 6 AP-2014]